MTGTKCDKCGIEITSGLMAAMCPFREKCEFWPEDEESQKFLDELNMRYVPGKGFPSNEGDYETDAAGTFKG